MSRRKPIRYSGAGMKCPYFSREEKLAVSCRCTGGMTPKLYFQTPEAKAAWCGKYCANHAYYLCPMCEMLDDELLTS